VEVARRRDASAEVEELPDPGVGGEVAGGAPEERPVRPRAEGQVRPGLERRVGGGPVGGVIVFAAQVEIVPRWMLSEWCVCIEEASPEYRSPGRASLGCSVMSWEFASAERRICAPRVPWP
jgi:hypothetical protein